MLTGAAAQELSADLTPPDATDGLGLPGEVAVPPATDLVDAPGLVHDVTGLAEDRTGIALPLDGLTGAEPAEDRTAAPAPTGQGSDSSVASQVAAVAAPAAGSALVALALGALALGGEGLRLLQARIAGGAVRLLRGAAGLAVAFPLFSRIERGAVMDNAQRARVHELVAQDPGLSLSEISARAGLAWGTTVHHLRRLEQHGMVVSQRDLGHRRFFLANTPAAAQRSAMAVVMHPTARRIAEYVAQRPGTDQAGLCEALGLNNPAASKHLSHFEQRGLVVAERSGRSRHYHPTGGLHSALLLLEPATVTAATTVTAVSRPALHASARMVAA